MVEYPQRNSRMVPASERVSAAILEHRLRHPGDPVLDAHVAAAVASRRSAEHASPTPVDATRRSGSTPALPWRWPCGLAPFPVATIPSPTCGPPATTVGFGAWSGGNRVAIVAGWTAEGTAGDGGDIEHRTKGEVATGGSVAPARDGRADRAATSPAGRPSIRTSGLLLGIGFGGFLDGIVLHQILQWHHMLTSTGDHPANTVAGLEDNTLADGLFHGLTFVASLVGLFLLWKAVRGGAQLAGRHLIGLMLMGWGLFNLVEGLIDHQILTVHHVNYENVVLWDTLFLVSGAVLLLGGWALSRSGEQVEDRGAV